MIILTIYDIVLNAWKRERLSSSLLELDTDFYAKCREYMVHLETQAKNDKDELVSKLFRKRWTRVNYLINDFLTLRMQKQITGILSGTDFTKKLPIEEMDLSKILHNQLASFRDKVLGIESNNEIKDIDETIEEGYSFAVFTQNENNESVGLDLNTYGPFEKGDFAILPKVNVRNYLIRSKIEEIDIDHNNG
ncbi:MAG: hypothetical protein HeimC2_12290 [Candidatus Heimdallarchaeota archaeon LC_2]|nr:MAG: hypothetical protein HeimC2_12290 [Candidatus Heimdallarchaeota archaeon LC_2]